MIRGEQGRLIIKEQSDRRVLFEFHIQKFSDQSSVPTPGMTETGIQGQVSFVETRCLETSGLGTIEGEIEDSHIQKANVLGVGHDKGEGMQRLEARLRRRAEEEIDIGRDTGLF